MMRDPHVVSLRYRLLAAEGVVFDGAPPIEWETEAFRMRLEDGIATFDMTEHHASENSARKRVDEYLRTWVIDAGLRVGHREMSLEFDKAELIDRDPLPGTGVALRGVVTATATAKARIVVRRGEYPRPPEGFVASPDVETMWARYEGYLEGREPLGSMAYACLTLLEGNAGGRQNAAAQHGISKDVLDRLAYLATGVGDERTGRKLKGRKERRPHTGPEIAWVEATVKALIRRVGELASDAEAPRSTLTMNDLPKL